MAEELVRIYIPLCKIRDKNYTTPDRKHHYCSRQEAEEAINQYAGHSFCNNIMFPEKENWWIEELNVGRGMLEEMVSAYDSLLKIALGRIRSH